MVTIQHGALDGGYCSGEATNPASLREAEVVSLIGPTRYQNSSDLKKRFSQNNNAMFCESLQCHFYFLLVITKLKVNTLQRLHTVP